MHILSNSATRLVSGGRPPLENEIADRIARDTTIGAGAGSAIGIIVSNSAAGAARDGAVGAALGFAWGVGYSIGTEVNNRLIDPWVMRQGS